MQLQAVREHWRRVGDARVADIVGAASDAIVSCDADDKVVLINAAACHMFGIEHAQAIARRCRPLLGEGRRPATRRRTPRPAPRSHARTASASRPRCRCPGSASESDA